MLSNSFTNSKKPHAPTLGTSGHCSTLHSTATGAQRVPAVDPGVDPMSQAEGVHPLLLLSLPWMPRKDVATYKLSAEKIHRPRDH